MKKVLTIIFFLLIIVFAACSNNEVNFDNFNTTNWKVSQEDFNSSYFDKINDYIVNKISDDIAPIDDYKHYVDDKNNHHIELASKKFYFMIDYIYYYDVKMIFSLSYYYFLDYKQEINIDDFMEIDFLISDFIDKFLYYPGKTSNIVAELFISEKKTENFYDNLIGNLGIKMTLMNKYRYFNVNFKTIFKDSDLILSKI